MVVVVVELPTLIWAVFGHPDCIWICVSLISWGRKFDFSAYHKMYFFKFIERHRSCPSVFLLYCFATKLMPAGLRSFTGAWLSIFLCLLWTPSIGFYLSTKIYFFFLVLYKGMCRRKYAIGFQLEVQILEHLFVKRLHNRWSLVVSVNLNWSLTIFSSIFPVTNYSWSMFMVSDLPVQHLSSLWPPLVVYSYSDIYCICSWSDHLI